MQKAAKSAQRLGVESFVDLVWAVPLHHQADLERGGRVLHRLKGLPQAGRRLVLLRGYGEGQAPNRIAL